MPVHARQFVIGPGPSVVRPGWSSRELAGGRVLSHDPALAVVEGSDGLVIGDALPTTPEAAGPDTWSGRWVLVAGGELRLDTGGTLGVFTRTTDAGTWASSSLELLRTIEPVLDPHADRLERDWRRMDWYPPPGSAIEGIERLLPSQRLDLDEGTRMRASLPRPTSEEPAVALARVRDRLVHAIDAAAVLAASAGGRLWIGLTSGRDSRVVLAAAVAAGLEPGTYTFLRAETTSGDRLVPPRLAAAVGLEHRFIGLDEVDPEREAAFDAHTSAGYTGGPRLQFVTGALDRFGPDDVLLEGGCFETARGYYYDRLPRAVADAAAAAEAVLERFPSQRPDAVRAWAAWAFADAEDGLDWRDRFYLEQRVGGWLSAGLQGFDASGRRSLHIANERGILGDLLGFPRPERRKATHESRLVEMMAPALAGFPYNPDETTADASAPGTGEGRGVLGRLKRFGRG